MFWVVWLTLSRQKTCDICIDSCISILSCFVLIFININILKMGIQATIQISFPCALRECAKPLKTSLLSTRRFTSGQAFDRSPKPTFSWFALVIVQARAISHTLCQGLIFSYFVQISRRLLLTQLHLTLFALIHSGELHAEQVAIQSSFLNWLWIPDFKFA